MRLATYNMFWGLDGRGPIKHLLGQYRMHRGFGYLLRPLIVEHDKKSTQVVINNSTIDDVVNRVFEANADTMAFQEVLPDVHGTQLEQAMRELGYRHFSWGRSGHNSYPLTMSALLASKEEGESLETGIQYTEYTGTGGGSAATYFPRQGLTIADLHLAIGKQPDDRAPQLDRLVDFVLEERSGGRKVILMGDLNVTFARLCEHDRFRQLGFHSASGHSFPSWGGPTAWSFIPFKGYGAFDQVMVHPDEFAITEVKLYKGISDHKMVVCNVEAV